MRPPQPDPDRERRRLDAILEKTPAIVVILRGRRFVVEACTPAADRLTGGRLVVGASILDATPELRAQGLFRALRRVYDSGEPIVRVAQPVALERGGQMRADYYDVVCHPTRDRDGAVDGILVLGVDVTREVAARRELEKALSARDEFLAAASHEIGTPLAIIELALEGLSRALRAQGVELDARSQGHLGRTRRAARRLARVRDALLDASRDRAGSVLLDGRDVDLAELVRNVADDLSDVALRYGSAVALEIDGPLRARVDPDRVAHALCGILENALKFGAGLPVAVRARATGGEARIEVEDRGHGIAAEDLERVFEPFERAASPWHYAGFGLGLWTARRVLQASGGDIEVESRPGSGTKFTVRLPLSARP